MEKELSKLVLSSTTVGDLASVCILFSLRNDKINLHLLLFFLTKLMDYIFDYQNAGSRREGATYDKIACALNLDKSNLLFMCNYGQGLWL